MNNLLNKEIKPLEDWTIGEIIRFCADHRNTCIECPACLGDDLDDCIFDVPPWELKSFIEKEE